MANVPLNLWERDNLEDVGVVLTKDNCAFFDEIMTHDKIGLSGHIPPFPHRSSCPSLEATAHLETTHKITLNPILLFVAL